MSIRVMTWVWNCSPVGGNERLVLLAIADNAADDGTNAWPSLHTLARKTLIDVRTVRRILRRLEAGGYLHVAIAAGPRGANLYTVIMQQPGAGDGPAGGATGTPGQNARGRSSPGDDTPGTPDRIGTGNPGRNRPRRTSGTSRNSPSVHAPNGSRGAALPPSPDIPRCHVHPHQTADRCASCRSEQLGGTW